MYCSVIQENRRAAVDTEERTYLQYIYQHLRHEIPDIGLICEARKVESVETVGDYRTTITRAHLERLQIRRICCGDQTGRHGLYLNDEHMRSANYHTLR